MAENKEGTKIIGMSKPMFYSVAGVVVFLIGFGVVTIFKNVKK